MGRKSGMKKLAMILMCLAIIFSTFTPSLAQGKSDIENHWAKEQLNQWVEKGLLQGYEDGTIKPNKSLTRAEFMTLINRSLDYSVGVQSNFKDVPKNAWYYETVNIAVKEGYITGFPDGTMKPNSTITRQEVAAIISRIKNLETAEPSFNDPIPAWSKGYVGAVQKAGYMQGSNNTFGPTKAITRAEAVVTLDRVMGNSAGSGGSKKEEDKKNDKGSGSYSGGGGGGSYTPPACDTAFSGTLYCAAGTFGPADASNPLTIQGNVKVDAENITLQNMIINGDLTLGAGIGIGEVTLNNVTVNGTTHVNGGGPESIHINNSILLTIIVNKNDGTVRIVANDGTRVQEVRVESAGIIQSSNRDNFREVNITSTVPQHANIELRGSYQTVNSTATNVRLNLASGADIDSLIVAAAAQVLGEGVVRSATINSPGVSLASPPTQTLVIAPNAGSVIIDGEENTGNSVASTTMDSIQITSASVLINLNGTVLGLTADDFELSATLDGQAYNLQNVAFNRNHNRFTFTPVDYAHLGKTLEVTVAPKAGTTKITGDAKSASTTVKRGFEGRIKDINGRGVSGVQIRFATADSISITTPDSITITTPDSISFTTADTITVTTGKYGYYSVDADPAVYMGLMSKDGYITMLMDATSLTGRYNVGQDGTILKAANADEIKIVLSWGHDPRDLDSHLLVPRATGTGHYHIAYYDKIYRENGILYADLDWDDVDRYGPETITIYGKTNGTYRYYVHNFSGSSTFPLRDSQATVTVYVGTSEPRTFNINNQAGDGTENYWLVFNMVVQDGNVTIVPIDEIRSVAPTNMN